jgi:serine/threonine protein kinase
MLVDVNPGMSKIPKCTPFPRDLNRERLMDETSEVTTLGGFRLVSEGKTIPLGTSYRGESVVDGSSARVIKLDSNFITPTEPLEEYLDRVSKLTSDDSASLVHLLNSGLDGDQPFLVHELVEGESLKPLVENMGAMPAMLATEFFKQALQGLMVLHDQSISHGAVTPDALFLTPTQLVERAGKMVSRPTPNSKIKLDYAGVHPRRSSLASIINNTDLLPGIEFAAPEQFDEEARTPRADLYSLAATMYFLLTTKGPFQDSDRPTLMQKIRIEDPVPIRSIRPDFMPEVANVLMRMLSKNPDERPATAREALLQLELASVPSATPIPDEPLPPEILHALHAKPEIEELPEANPLDDHATESHFDAIDSASSSTPSAYLPTTTEPIKNRTIQYLIIGGIGNGLAIIMILGYFVFGWFDDSPKAPPKDTRIEESDRPNNRRTGSKNSKKNSEPKEIIENDSP